MHTRCHLLPKAPQGVGQGEPSTAAGVAGVGVGAPGCQGTSSRPSTAGSGSCKVGKRQFSQTSLLLAIGHPLACKQVSRQELHVPMGAGMPASESSGGVLTAAAR